jgi:hypothetical protein
MLHNRTIHFGFSIAVPLERVMQENMIALEKAMHGNKTEVVGRDTPKPDVHELKCKDPDGSCYKIRIMKSGEVQSAVREPIYTIAVLMAEDGDHTKMCSIFPLCLETVYKVFSAPRFTIFKESTIRTIWGTTEEPAFQFLWEKILKQKPESLLSFGTPFLGGGLKLVVAPYAIKGPTGEPSNEVAQAEYKIESYFRDPRYIFVESKYIWTNAIQYETIGALNEAVKMDITHVIEHTEKAAKQFLRE